MSAQIVQWFDLGGSLKLDESVDSATMVHQLASIQGLMEKVRNLGLSASEPDAVRAAAAEFILEGLYAHRRISRSEERGFAAEEKRREPAGRERKKAATRRAGTGVSIIEGPLNEVDQIFPLHRRRLRHRLRRPAAGALRFPARKRLQHPVHALQRVEPAHARRSEERHPAGARAGQDVPRRSPGADDGEAPGPLRRSSSSSCSTA